MWNLSGKAIGLLILLLLNACNFPRPVANASNVPVTSDVVLVQETDTPSQDFLYAECGFVWARETLPDISQEFKEALKKVQPQADGYAEAYGENCINSQGEVVRFLALETDFYVTLKVKDLGDKQVLGELIEQVLSTVAEFPPEETPGPQAGYVGITFDSPGDDLRLWFTQTDAKTAIENGLQGKELFNALQTR